MAALETVSVPGTSEGVRRAADAFDEFSRAVGLPPTGRRRCLVALDEILSNIVTHGLGGRSGTTITLTFSFDQGVVRFEVEDDAVAFNPLTAPPADVRATLEDRKVGGLGLTLVRHFMDEVRYERRGDRNHLSLAWRVEVDASASGKRHANH